MLRALIGITPVVERSGNQFNISTSNTKAIEQAGGIPFILPLTENEAIIEEIAGKIDGLYLTGGNDIDPTYFGEEPHPKLGGIHPLRDFFEISIVKKMIDLKKPILGVCRGSQVMNVALGGTMYQDIYSQIDHQLLQHQQNAPVDHASHFIEILKGSLLHQIVGEEKIKVNSRHHQANRKVGKGLQQSAQASDGVPEAIEHTEHPFALGLQWHPENLLVAGDEPSQKIYTRFIKECTRNKDWTVE